MKVYALLPYYNIHLYLTVDRQFLLTQSDNVLHSQ